MRFGDARESPSLSNNRKLRYLPIETTHIRTLKKRKGKIIHTYWLGSSLFKSFSPEGVIIVASRLQIAPGFKLGSKCLGSRPLNSLLIKRTSMPSGIR